jgi:geranylgeranyl diphosphate synthase type 3
MYVAVSFRFVSLRGLTMDTETDICLLTHVLFFSDMKSKSFCEDLTEGKFSFPIIHCVRQDESDTRLLSILKQRTEDTDVKRYAQGLMRQAGSLAYTRKKCSELKDAVVADIEAFGGNPPLARLIEILDVQLENIETSNGGTQGDRRDVQIEQA